MLLFNILLQMFSFESFYSCLYMNYFQEFTCSSLTVQDTVSVICMSCACRVQTICSQFRTVSFLALYKQTCTVT